MFFNAKFVAALLAICGGVEAKTALKSRTAASKLSLYAYGTNITGLSVFYADSMNNDSIYSRLSLHASVMIS